MPELIVSCPTCAARLRVAAAAQGRESIHCPKCGTAVPLRRQPPAPPPRPVPVAELVEELDEVLPADEIDELEEVRPARVRPKRRPPPVDEEDEYDEYDDEEEDDRPRGRRRRVGKKEGPWQVALAVAPGAFVLAFLGCLLIGGTSGLPEAKEGGPLAKFFGLGLLLLVCGVLILFGVVGVRDRHTTGKWGIQIRGTAAVWVGMIQTFFGGLLAGMAVYGLLFEVYHLIF